MNCSNLIIIFVFGRLCKNEKKGLKEWEEYKEFWSEHFSILDNYSKFINQPLRFQSDTDVQAFIALDPVHSPTLKTAHEAVKYSVVESVVGVVSTAGCPKNAWKWPNLPNNLWYVKSFFSQFCY